jgi:tRNA modification GTPase
MKLIEPWRLTLAGPPNVGKSSLTNTLVGAARVLVHHEPGTTRDAVETSIVVSSWPVVLTDTAGVRQPVESIESQGIAAARLRWRAADIGLLVVDATAGWTPTHSELLSDRSGVTIVLLNKSDLQSKVVLPDETLADVSGLRGPAGPVKTVVTAATGPTGVALLIDALGEHFDALMPPAGAGVPFLAEHVALVRAVEAKLADGQPVQAQEVIISYLASGPGAKATP